MTLTKSQTLLFTFLTCLTAPAFAGDDCHPRCINEYNCCASQHCVWYNFYEKYIIAKGHCHPNDPNDANYRAQPVLHAPLGAAHPAFCVNPNTCDTRIMFECCDGFECKQPMGGQGGRCVAVNEMEAPARRLHQSDDSEAGSGSGLRRRLAAAASVDDSEDGSGSGSGDVPTVVHRRRRLAQSTCVNPGLCVDWEFSELACCRGYQCTKLPQHQGSVCVRKNRRLGASRLGCQTSADCGFGGVCKDNVCIAGPLPPTLGEKLGCQTSADCGFGGVCKDNVCIAGPLPPTLGEKLGCQTSADCGFGGVCYHVMDGGVCVAEPHPPLGASPLGCQTTADCGFGGVCEHNICVPGPLPPTLGAAHPAFCVNPNTCDTRIMFECCDGFECKQPMGGQGGRCVAVNARRLSSCVNPDVCELDVMFPCCAGYECKPGRMPGSSPNCVAVNDREDYDGRRRVGPAYPECLHDYRTCHDDSDCCSGHCLSGICGLLN